MSEMSSRHEIIVITDSCLSIRFQCSMNRDTFPKNVVAANYNRSNCFWTGSMLRLPTNNRMFTNLIVGTYGNPTFDNGTASNCSIVSQRDTGFNGRKCRYCNADSQFSFGTHECQWMNAHELPVVRGCTARMPTQRFIGLQAVRIQSHFVRIKNKVTPKSAYSSCFPKSS